MLMGTEKKMPLLAMMMLCMTVCIYVGCNEDADPGNFGDSCETAMNCAEGLECIQGICGSSDTSDGDMETAEVEETAESDFEPSDPELTWVHIEGGIFDMGCSHEEELCYPDDEETHAEQVDSFEITATEITQAQYAAVTGEYPSEFEDCPDCPVESVSWSDASNFCWLVTASLPRGKQWEYAARAGTTTRYYCGDSQSCVDGIAWYGDNSDGHPHPVGLKAPNAWGLYDMLGNVDEWVQDEFRPEYVYPGMEGITYRVIRGGNWQIVAGGIRAAFIAYAPQADDSLSNKTGFRCVKWVL